GVELAPALITREELVPVGRNLERVPAHEHRARRLRLPEPHDEVRKADQSIAWSPFRAAHRLGQRVVGPVCERVSVDDQERSGGFPGHATFVSYPGADEGVSWAGGCGCRRWCRRVRGGGSGYELWVFRRSGRRCYPAT